MFCNKCLSVISEALCQVIPYAWWWNSCMVESSGEARRTTGFVPFEGCWLNYPLGEITECSYYGINWSVPPQCKHLGPQGMFRWLMITFIVTNEFVQLNRSLSLIWLYDKRGPSISVILKGDLGFQLIYVKAKDLSSPKCHKVEKDT